MNLLRVFLLLQLTTPLALGQAAGNSKPPGLPALIGDGECVTAAAHFSGVPPRTRKWREGKPVVVNGEVDPSIPIGTAVATFDSNGQYFPHSENKNCGIYLGPDTKGSFRLLDQWPTERDARGNVIRQAVPPHVRSISPNGAYPSDYSGAYYVIIVPK
jgi:hypothetical protein